MGKKQLFKFLKRLLWNALTQPHCNYGYASWYHPLSKSFKNKLRISQNKCICFCLELALCGHMVSSHFPEKNWQETDQLNPD